MRLQRIGLVSFVLGLTAALPTPGFGQQHRDRQLGPLSEVPVLNAPFSADATTVIRQTNPDGTRLERKATARYYRDSEGRVRVDYQVPVTDTRDPAAPRKTVFMVTAEPGDRLAYVVDPAAQTIRRGHAGVAGSAFNAGRSFAIPTGQIRFTLFTTLDLDEPNEYVKDLGSETIGGIAATGRRLMGATIGQVAERWESSELHLVVRARHADPAKGVQIDHLLTNIRLGEPSPSLFVVPEDFTVLTDHRDTVVYRSEPPDVERKNRALERK